MAENNDIPSKSDAELVKLSLTDQDNFLFIIKRYETRLLRYVRRISNASLEDAEDLLQEIFLKVYLKLNDFDQELKFSSWIYRIAHNQVISNYRKLKARPQSISMDENSELIENLIADLDIALAADRSLLKDAIYKILDKLDDKYKEVLVLKYFEDKNYREISDILQKPLGTVGTLLNKAKQKFRQELKK